MTPLTSQFTLFLGSCKLQLHSRIIQRLVDSARVGEHGVPSATASFVRLNLAESGASTMYSTKQSVDGSAQSLP